VLLLFGSGGNTLIITVAAVIVSDRSPGRLRDIIPAMKPWDVIQPVAAPGLIVTGTDTGVGKTLVTCCIARALADMGRAVGPCKPLVSGCRREGGGLIGEDAELLMSAAGGPREGVTMREVSPVRYAPPLAPAPAAEASGELPDWSAVQHALEQVRAHSDVVLIEGVGGLGVPLDPRDPAWCFDTFAARLGLPVLLVARAALGTLNHTLLSVHRLRTLGCDIRGVVMNHAPSPLMVDADDVSVQTNRDWIERTTGLPVLAEVPAVTEAATVNNPCPPAALEALRETSAALFE